MKTAKYLYEMYHALVNTRTYKIRQDWAQSFKRIMHWPKADEINRVDSRDAIIVLRHSSSINPDYFSREQLGSLLRTAIIMAVSAMDTYYHAKVVDNVVKSIKAGEFAPALDTVKMSVPEYLKSCKRKYKKVAVRQSVDNHLSYRALQNPDKISEAIKLLGIESLWQKVAQELKKEDGDVRKRISEIVKRRNEIAHSADISRSYKASNSLRAIEPKWVHDSILFISDVVKASEKVINDELGIKGS